MTKAIKAQAINVHAGRAKALNVHTACREGQASDRRTRASHSSKSHSGKSHSGQSHSGKNSPAAFSDAFLRNWIDDRLGSTEVRPLLLLRADFSSTESMADRGDLAEVIRSHGGYVVCRRSNQIIGAWGLSECDPADRQRAILAAAAVCQRAFQHGGSTCLLHAKNVSVAKNLPHENDDTIVLALAGVPEGAHIISSLPGTIVITESYKEVCCLQNGLLPIGTSAAGVAPTAPVLYAFEPSTGHDEQMSLPPAVGPLAWMSKIDATGDLKPLIVAAAIIGRVFTLDLLARMLGMERQRLRDAIAVARTLGLIKKEPSPKGVERYVFRSKELQRFAYALVPPQNRLRLHRRVADVLSQSPADAVASPPAQVARHHRIADNPLQSRRWLCKAAWQAVATDDAPGAVALLEKALEQDRGAASVSASRRSLLQLLGVQLALAKGNGADAVFDAHQRSMDTSDRASYLAWRQELRSLWLAQSTHLVKGEVRAALTLGNWLLMHVRRQADRSVRTLGMNILAHRMQALSLMLSGELCSALEHYDMVIRDYDETRHASLRYAYGSDQLALAHAHRAWTLALSCRSNDVSRAVRQARRTCDRLNHPHTTAHAISVVAITSLVSGAFDEALFAAREARAIAVEYSFPYWVAWADVILAALDAQENARNGYTRLEEAMAAYQATGAAQLCPFIYGLLSTAALGASQPGMALRQADAGLALIAQNGCALYRPELQRYRAEALFALDRTAEADAAMRAGYDEAHQFGATLVERAIARVGQRITADQQQIGWQTRYHAAV